MTALAPFFGVDLNICPDSLKLNIKLARYVSNFVLVVF